MPVNAGTRGEARGKTYERREKLERYLIALTLQGEERTEWWQELDPDWFKESYLKRLIHEVQQLTQQQTGLVPRKLLSLLPAELTDLVQEIYSMDQALWRMKITELEKARGVALRDLRLITIRQDLQQVTNKLTQLPEESAERIHLQTQYRALTSSLKSLG
jgi:hypothetical protein